MTPNWKKNPWQIFKLSQNIKSCQPSNLVICELTMSQYCRASWLALRYLYRFAFINFKPPLASDQSVSDKWTGLIWSRSLQVLLDCICNVPFTIALDDNLLPLIKNIEDNNSQACWQLSNKVFHIILLDKHQQHSHIKPWTAWHGKTMLTVLTKRMTGTPLLLLWLLLSSRFS